MLSFPYSCLLKTYGYFEQANQSSLLKIPPCFEHSRPFCLLKIGGCFEQRYKKIYKKIYRRKKEGSASLRIFGFSSLPFSIFFTHLFALIFSYSLSYLSHSFQSPSILFRPLHIYLYLSPSISIYLIHHIDTLNINSEYQYCLFCFSDAWRTNPARAWRLSPPQGRLCRARAPRTRGQITPINSQRQTETAGIYTNSQKCISIWFA